MPSDVRLTSAQRDQTIIELRKRGYSYRAIGKASAWTHPASCEPYAAWKPAAQAPDPHTHDTAPTPS